MAEEYISLRPSDAVHGGGMVPEGDYEITDAKFAMWDYNGTVAIAVPALGIEFKNADEQSYTQFYSAGDAKNLLPSDDGKRLKKVGSITGLNDSSNCFQFLKALVNAGYPEDKLGNDISQLIGMKVAVIHEATAGRTIKGTAKAAGIMVVVGKIHSMPGEKAKAGGKAAGAKASAGKGANGAADTTVITPTATQLLIDALKSNSGAMEKKKLTSAIFTKIANTDPNRSAILNLVIQDDFLSSLADQGVLYDAANGQVLYAGA